MSKTKVKICGVCKPSDMTELTKLPLDYLGFVFHPTSPRHISYESAKKCIQQLNNSCILSVGVFVNQTASEIQEVYENLNLKYVQLHGDISRKEQKHLPKHLARIYVIELSTHQDLTSSLSSLKELDAERDYVLFDLKKDEPNKNIHFTHLLPILKKVMPFRYFIAGGLNVSNINNYINTFSPFAVDMASSIEKENRHKNIDLIRQLIQIVHEENDASR